jgi:hypothetical protein
MLYHGAAHYAASFALCGLAEAVELWRGLGFDEAAALRALLPMLAGTIETARDKGNANALAGPVSRGDTGIVERQLALLEAHGGDHATLYALMTRRAVALAAQRTAPPATLPALAQAVEASLARTTGTLAARRGVIRCRPMRRSGVGGRTLLDCIKGCQRCSARSPVFCSIPSSRCSAPR